MKKILLLILFFGQSLELLLGQAGSASPDPERWYIVMVDTSLSMSRLGGPLRQAVYDLIVSGIQGQMRPGDPYTIWTFNEEVHTRGFVPMNWDPALNRTLAGGAGNYLKQQRFEKTTHLEKAINELLQAARFSPSITALILSDGDDTLQGTTFDREINAVYRQRARQVSKAKKVFITRLVMQNGRLTSWSVTASGEPIPWPDNRPAIAQAAPPPIVESPANPTNATPAIIQPVPTPPTNVVAVVQEEKPVEPAPSKKALEPAAVKSDEPAKTTPVKAVPLPQDSAPPTTVEPAPPKVESVVTPPPPVQPPAPTPSAPSILLASNGLPVETRSLAAEFRPPVPAPRPTTTATRSDEEQSRISSARLSLEPLPIPPVATNDTPRASVAVQPPKPAPSPAPPESLKTESKKTPPAGATPKSLPVQTAVALPPQQGNWPGTFLVAGCAVLALGVIFALYVLRKNRTPRTPSLISQTIDRDNK